MKILVAVKRVVDAYVAVRIKADGSGIETNGVKMAMNPFDEIALEESIRLKEAGKVSEVIALSIGNDDAQESLRVAMALGADRAIFVPTQETCEPLVLAKIIKAIALRENVQAVFLGKQAIDSDDNQVGQMLAGLLNWPQGTFISQCDWQQDHVVVHREIDGGTESLRLNLPCVLTTDLRLNTPRYASLPNIMKAKKKEITVIALDDLAVNKTSHVKTLHIEAPPPRQAGIKLHSVEELIEKLKHEAQVIE